MLVTTEQLPLTLTLTLIVLVHIRAVCMAHTKLESVCLVGWCDLFLWLLHQLCEGSLGVRTCREQLLMCS